ncbi:MAG: hypothetical protein C4527_00125 [Candidatus Omnitrophota bacterium]|jgi:aspartyl-tRNA(Asn)/glutamyl-tRNA(Gln) amidotransferase subunit A|nr:MAG: hypothetical protein C4527_00125 [Candidatus Omnitrophota bacterium]
MQENLFSYVNASPSSAAAGLLAGKSFLLQPNLSVGGWPCEAGSTALEKYVALEDATIVEKIKNAGATLAGSARMAELGLGLSGDSSARIFSEGKCNVALISDTMGEARVTASLARAFGFKPSWGIISRFGLIGLAPSMECSGIMARTIGDLSATLQVLVGSDRRDPSMLQERLPDGAKVDEPDRVATLGVIRECIDTLPAAESSALRSVFPAMEKSGTAICEVSLPDFKQFRTVHNIVGSVEASSSAGKYDGVRYGHRAENAENWNEMYLRSRAESFGLIMKSYLFQGAYFQFRDYTAFEDACRIRRRLVDTTKAFYKDVDFLLFPTRSAAQNQRSPASIDEMYDAFALTLPANVTGQPSLTVPGLLQCDGVDLGLQLVGAYLDDARLLAFAGRLVDTISDLHQ